MIYIYIYIFFNFFIYLFFYQGTRPGKCPILNPTPVCAKITGCRSDEECLFGSRCCLQQGCKRECVRVEDVPPPPPCELILNYLCLMRCLSVSSDIWISIKKPFHAHTKVDQMIKGIICSCWIYVCICWCWDRFFCALAFL